MAAPDGTSGKTVEIVPLVVVVQAFAARPSSLPDIREFVRQHLTQRAFSEFDLRALTERTTDLLLEAAGLGRMIQVSLRIFEERAEVDVLYADLSEGYGVTAVAGTAPAPARSPEASPPAQLPTDDSSTSFADWLSGALRRERMTMEVAAHRLGVSVKTIRRWASGVTEPRLGDLTRIREVFGDLPFP